MRQLHRTQRGSANWPFILSLLLLLVFVYLWYSQRDDLDAAVAERNTAEQERDVARQAAVDVATYAKDLSELVGWNSQLVGDVMANAPTEVKNEINRLPGVQDYYLTDLSRLKSHLTPDGTVGDSGQPGLLNALINRAQVAIQAEIRRATAEGVEETPVNFDFMSDELRQAVKELNALEVPQPPVKPTDSDDASAVADYESAMEAYLEARKRWEETANKVVNAEGYEQLAEVITGPGKFDPDTMQAVLLDMFAQPPTGEVTVADIVTFPPQIIERYNEAFAANKTEDQAVISRLQADNSAKDTEIADLQQQLEAEQNRHTSDVEQLRSELSQANETAEQNRRDATTALNDLNREREDKQVVVTDRETRIRALEERIRLDKEKRDLEVRRDDPDGRILTANPRMQTAMIDLGSSAKVYPGLKFRVSRIGRGGLREVVGEVTVVDVTGPNSAKVAISGLVNPRDPVLAGDIISNPFYKATAPIYLYLAGELERYPLEVLSSRLSKMNVIIDNKPSGRTDYIVVPNAMAAPADVAEGGDEGMEEDEGAAGAKSEFERIQSLARTLGAQVITERMLNDFLGL